jgi:threonine/homoserine/homoserine lactone efflux protein
LPARRPRALSEPPAWRGQTRGHASRRHAPSRYSSDARRPRAVRRHLRAADPDPGAVFFTSFLPQFVHGSGPAFASLLLLGAFFAALTLAWLCAYAFLIGHGASALRRPAVRRALDRFTGVVLVAFGVRLAFEHR